MAHRYVTGVLQRVHVWRHANVLKRLLIHACGYNLDLLKRRLMGIGALRTVVVATAQQAVHHHGQLAGHGGHRSSQLTKRLSLGNADSCGPIPITIVRTVPTLMLSMHVRTTPVTCHSILRSLSSPRTRRVSAPPIATSEFPPPTALPPKAPRISSSKFAPQAVRLVALRQEPHLPLRQAQLHS